MVSEEKAISELINNRKVQIWIIGILIIAVLPYFFKPIDFGMDFKGGTMINIKLENKATAAEIPEVINILQDRLNSFGLKDIKVRQSGDEFITIEIAETDPKIVSQLQSIIAEQGKFETLFEGNVILRGDQIQEVITNPQQGFGWRKSTNGYEWSVPFLLTNEGATSFANSVKGKCTLQDDGKRCEELVFMFIDRPANSTVLISRETYENEKLVPIDFDSSETVIPFEKLMDNSGIEYIVTDSINQNISEEIRNKIIIIESGKFNITQLSGAAKLKEIKKIGKYWIENAINVENIVYLTPGVTTGKPITEPTITGFSQNEEQASIDVKRVEILLRSGKLPVEVSIDNIVTVSPILGKDFLTNSIIAGFFSVLAVAGVIYIRYKKLKIIIPLLVTAFSEVAMTLGMAVWIGWQLDLAGVAGIIAVVGTGVEDQIIMIDELLRKVKEDEETSIIAKIKKAFGIIIMAVVTLIAAMIPLWFIGTGTLRGFALTTIMGSLISILISRPAFAEIIKKILEE